MSNHVEERINGGMSAIAAFLTDATCGEACWQAREDICRCSCGGKNHGCMRSADGQQPERTARIDGYRFKLAGVGDGVWDTAKNINTAAGYTFVYASTSRDMPYVPAKLRYPSDRQIDTWPELTAYRDGRAWTDEAGQKHYVDKPYLLWVRIDQSA
jgi:hypothetical protein